MEDRDADWVLRLGTLGQPDEDGLQGYVRRQLVASQLSSLGEAPAHQFRDELRSHDASGGPYGRPWCVFDPNSCWRAPYKSFARVCLLGNTIAADSLRGLRAP
jgi:hypothetical protein